MSLISSAKRFGSVLLGTAHDKAEAEESDKVCQAMRAKTQDALDDLLLEVIMMHNTRTAPGLHGVAH